MPVAVPIGTARALFLWSLDAATRARFQPAWLLFLLPLAGIAVGAVHQFFGKLVEGGNNLIVDQIHEPGGGMPRRMTPLILVATVMTPISGGSAGPEGTAVQMSGSIASGFGRRSTACRRLLARNFTCNSPVSRAACRRSQCSKRI